MSTRTHGLSNTPTYYTWVDMRRRCGYPKHPDYAAYGAQGIKVCDEWDRSFEAFLRDMGPKPEGKTIDRFPNKSGNYEPGNCRWATPTEQSQNTRIARNLTLNGETHCRSEWERKLGLSRGAVAHRLRNGWSEERALSMGRTRRGGKPV